MINKEGRTLIKFFFAIALAGYMLSYWVRSFVILGAIFLVLTLFLVYFFRDPERNILEDKNVIYSPADGTVIQIQKEPEPAFLKTEATVVRIFMTPLNVHIQRAPIKGRIEYLEYKKGKFLPANLDKAASDNEQNLIGINGGVKVLIKQIAGILARRIVCWMHMEQGVSQGERIGMIKFGSQVDIYLPENIELKVKVKEKVKAGLTVLGEIK